MTFLLLLACTPAPTCTDDTLEPDAPGFPFTEAIPTFSLTLSEEARNALPAVASEAGPDVPATFGWSGEEWEVGLDLKGNTSFRTLEEKASFKIDFHEFHEDETFHGLRRLRLDSMVGDRTMLAAHLAYDLYARLGVPAPRQGFACVEVDGEDFGLYSLVETLDEQFLERAFEEPDGWLFDRSGLGDLTPEGVGAFEIEEDGEGDGRGALRDLVVEIDTAPALLPVLEARFDADALLTELTVEYAIAAVDGYALNANNFLLYLEPAAGRWWLLPWGIDQAFGLPANVVTMDAERSGMLARRCLEESEWKQALLTKLGPVADAMAELDAPEAVERIRRFAEADPRTETSDTERWFAWQDLLAFVDGRPEALREVGG